MVIGVKVGGMLMAKLDEFCQLTGRPRSTVIRALLMGCSVEDLPDEWIREDPEDRQRRAEIEGR
jgi:hypothetical protein